MMSALEEYQKSISVLLESCEKYDRGYEGYGWSTIRGLLSITHEDGILAAEELAAKDAELSALRERVEALERVEKVAREITAVVESAAVVRLAKPCKHGNYATAPYNHAWFCDDCWIEMQNALAALQAP